MQRFSTWARWIATGILVVVGAIFTSVVFPVAVQQPREAANAFWEFLHVVLKFLRDLSEHPWVRVSVLTVGAFVAGLWLDWLLRRLDGFRAERREALGTEMVSLGDYLRFSQLPTYQARPQITSCFTTAKKFGIWVPDQRIFEISKRAENLIMEHPIRNLITDYLAHVGTMLKDGHFREAKRDAKKSKAAFDKAYAQHRLPST